MIKLDLHLHTTVSDGLYEPREVARQAVEKGLEIISITDHDAFGGCLEVEKMDLSGINVIPGIEFSTSVDNREIHVLGYFPGGIPDSLEKFVKNVQASREARIYEGIKRLRKKGLDISIEEVLAFKTGEIISRSHMARAMYKKRLVRNISEAFARFLGNEVDFVPPSRFTPFEIVEYLVGEKALAVWAHPDIEDFDKYISEMISAGLAGVEVTSRRSDKGTAQYFERVASDFGLFPTFGSDWHGHGNEHLAGLELEKTRLQGFLDKCDGQIQLAERE